MADRILLTRAGRERLLTQLAELKGPKRQQAHEGIREARSHGDLRENAAYDQMRLVASRLEGRIKDLEWVLDHATIVERPEGVGDLLHLGSVATIREVETGDEMEVRLVGAYESEPTEGLISIVSPLGQALIEHAAGDIITVPTPQGEVRYEITMVSQMQSE
jgi:transcription elongation factor GreA